MSRRGEDLCALLRTGPIVAVCLLVLSGCGLRAVPDCALPEQELRHVRNVSAVIVIDEQTARDGMAEFLEEAFGIFFRQTGIRARIGDWKTTRWKGSSRTELLQQLEDEMRRYGRPFDVAIAIYEMDPLQQLGFNLVGGWGGVIDDEYRRFIVVRRDRVRVLVHELGHAFLFRRVHTGGVMEAFNVCMIGDRLCDNDSVCFLDSDAAEIIRNKWRDFEEKPDLPERQNLISGYAYFKTYLKLFLELFASPSPH